MKSLLFNTMLFLAVALCSQLLFGGNICLKAEEEDLSSGVRYDDIEVFRKLLQSETSSLRKKFFMIAAATNLSVTNSDLERSLFFRLTFNDKFCVYEDVLEKGSDREVLTAASLIVHFENDKRYLPLLQKAYIRLRNYEDALGSDRFDLLAKMIKMRDPSMVSLYQKVLDLGDQAEELPEISPTVWSERYICMYGLAGYVKDNPSLYKCLREYMVKYSADIQEQGISGYVFLGEQNCLSAVPFLVETDVQHKDLAKGSVALLFYTDRGVLSQLLELTQNKNKEVAEKAWDFLVWIVQDDSEPKKGDYTAWSLWLKERLDNIYRVMPIDNSRLPFRAPRWSEGKFVVVDVERLLKGLESPNGKERKRNLKRLLYYVPDLRPLLEKKEELIINDGASPEFVKELLTWYTREKKTLKWNGEQFSKQQHYDVSILDKLAARLTVRGEHKKDIAVLKSRLSDSSLTEEEFYHIVDRLSAEIKDEELLEVKSQFRDLTRTVVAPMKYGDEVDDFVLWLRANRFYLEWNSKEKYFAINEDAKSAGVPVAKWRLIPEDKCKNWKELSDKEKMQLLDEAAEKLPEVIVPTKPPKKVGE